MVKYLMVSYADRTENYKNYMRDTELTAGRAESSEDALRTMKGIPKEERPYEKCFEHGAESLTDAELLAVILRTGVKGESALELSRKLLARGKEANGLLGIYHMSISDLTKVKGLGRVKAVQLKCVAELSRRIARATFSEGMSFKEPKSVARYYMEELRHREQEVLMLVMLNSKGRLLKDQIISQGTVSGSLTSPREIFIEAMRNQAVNIILLHNHPSGDPTPSREDIILTQRVRKAGAIVGIELLDHIIIGDCQAVSMREQPFWRAKESMRGTMNVISEDLWDRSGDRYD